MKRVRTPIDVRFCDTDMIGHVNNTKIAQYAESGRIGFFREIGVEGSTLILAHLSLDFTAQIQLDDQVVIETWCESIGNTSIRLQQELFASGRIAARIGAVVLTFDYESNAPTRVPDALRQRLVAYQPQEV